MIVILPSGLGHANIPCVENFLLGPSLNMSNIYYRRSQAANAEELHKRQSATARQH